MNLFNWFKSEKNIDTARPVRSVGTWKPLVHEPFTGAWERGQELQIKDSLTSYAVFACISLISKDVGKLPIIARTEENGIKTNVKFKGLAVINKPNKYQTRQQFLESWVTSKAASGNAYIYKIRDVYGEIEQLIVLDHTTTVVCVDPDGEVFYRIHEDPLNNSGEQLLVPASEIIHDRQNTLYHPLIGLSPIVACGLTASTGENIQKYSNKFFGNDARPSGILATSEDLDDEEGDKIQKGWDKKYSNGGEGGVALVSGGVTYQALSVPAADSQLIENLKLSGEIVCTTFNVPSFMVGIGTAPSGSVEYLNSRYFSACLQSYIEAIENLLNEHIEKPSNVVLEFDPRSLFRMDSNAQMSYLASGTGAGLLSPNEGRAVLGYAPVEGGESPVMQQQNYSLAALSKRDAKEDPFSTAPATTEAPTEPSNDVSDPSATTGSEEVLEAPSDKLKAIYKGVFDLNKEYEVGSFITHKGSLWHCDNKHSGEFDYSNFTLAVKKGEANNVN